MYIENNMQQSVPDSGKCTWVISHLASIWSGLIFFVSLYFFFENQYFVIFVNIYVKILQHINRKHPL